jgi:tetratricopeptide (TPR) repeat protein
MLQSLVDKSMVGHTPDGRYQFHDLLRQFASQRLEGDAEHFRECYTRHSRFYLQTLKGWGADLKSPRQREALETIDREAENLRAAWRWAVVTQDWQGIAAGLEGMSWYADLRFRFEEGERACRTALEALTETPDKIRLELRLLTWQSRFLSKLGQREAAQQLIARGQTLLESGQDHGLDMRREQANLSFEQAEMAYYTDRSAANQHYQDSLVLYQELQDEWQAGAALMSLGELVHHSGNFMKARVLLSQALAYLRKVGEPSRMACTLRWLAFNEARLGQLAQAEQILRESVALRQASGSPLDVALANDDLGTLMSWSGKYAEGATLMEQSLAVYQDLGYQSKEIWAHDMLGLQYLMQGMYPEARSHSEAALQLARPAGALREIAVAHYLLGCVALGEGEYSKAYDDLGESLRIYRQIDQKDELGWALIARAIAARACGQVREAQGHIIEAAEIVVALRGFSTVSSFIPAAALFSIDQGNVEKALELFALASGFPNISQARWFQDIAWGQVLIAAQSLPEEVACAARARGQERDLFATAEELLHELSRPPL